MNPDLYTDEFRNFKYLRSQPSTVAYFKDSTKWINTIRPLSHKDDPTFNWPHRIEFIEQLIDLGRGTAYFVESGNLSPSSSSLGLSYEDANLFVIENPVVAEGSIIDPAFSSRIATLEDVPAIEDHDRNADFFICTRMYLEDFGHWSRRGSIFKVRSTPLVPHDLVYYSAVFYDKATAEEYRTELTHFLRHGDWSLSKVPFGR